MLYAVAGPLHLDSAVASLPRVAAADARRLRRLGVHTVRELLLNLPYGWEEYGGPVPIARLEPGSQATVVGTVRRIGERPTRRGVRLTEAVVEDDDGSAMHVVWFNQRYLARQLKRGDRVAIAGPVRQSRYGAGLEMQHPHHELVQADGAPRRIGGLMPKYHLTAGLTSRKVAAWVEAALPLAGGLEEV